GGRWRQQHGRGRRRNGDLMLPERDHTSEGEGCGAERAAPCVARCGGAAEALARTNLLLLLHLADDAAHRNTSSTTSSATATLQPWFAPAIAPMRAGSAYSTTPARAFLSLRVAIKMSLGVWSAGISL